MQCFSFKTLIKRKRKMASNSDPPPPYPNDCAFPASFNNEKASDIENLVNKELKRVSAELREISLKIHDNPEISWKEYQAHDLLTSYLEQQGFTVERQAYVPTGFKATFAKSQGPTVAFCSEYDALPGIGHGCGHNLIAIAGVACALGLKKLLEEGAVRGKVILFGTPAEEDTGGKLNFLKAGAFRDVDFAMMIHPGPMDSIYCPTMAIQMLKVEYFGRSAHAAGAPWEGVNALDAAVQAYNSISMLRQQTLPRNRIHGIIIKGGDAPNIIPEYASMEFGIRTYKREELHTLYDQVEACFKAAAISTGCRVEIHKYGQYLNVVQNSVLADRFVEHMHQNGVDYPTRQEEENHTPMGSTDFGDVSYNVPGLHPMVGVGTDAPLHTIDFAKAAATMTAHHSALRSAKCLVLAAAEVMLDPELLRAAKREWEDAVKLV
ncbi:uncharacterized protein VTP21DRAFT_2548 [Calcarisporiella thermophila]|uniref:uncharacterized protein n=1 Tax=Calcarisporiella thermophila TaxID=911321 RepID=UPI003742F5B3